MSESEGSIPEPHKIYKNELGLTRWLPMAEWITVALAGDRRIVRVRIQQVEREFVLTKDEANHLASLLTDQAR